MRIFNWLSPELTSGLYTDTDSIYILCKRDKFEDCILESKREAYEREKGEVFGNLDEEKSQAGLMISEGEYRQVYSLHELHSVLTSRC